MSKKANTGNGQTNQANMGEDPKSYAERLRTAGAAESAGDTVALTTVTEATLDRALGVSRDLLAKASPTLIDELMAEGDYEFAPRHTKLEPGHVLRGWFVGESQVESVDKRTGEVKPIKTYVFADDNDVKIAFTETHQLNKELYSRVVGPDGEARMVPRLGEFFVIARFDDIRGSSGNIVAQYQVAVKKGIRKGDGLAGQSKAS